jgi:hypothetical protein
MPAAAARRRIIACPAFYEPCTDNLRHDRQHHWVLRNPPPVESTQSGPTIDTSIQAGYAFVAMPIDNDDHQLGYKGLSDYRVSQHERTKGWDHEETHCADRKAERLDAENLLYFPMGI